MASPFTHSRPGRPDVFRAASGSRCSARTRQPPASRRSATAPPTPPDLAAAAPAAVPAAPGAGDSLAGSIRIPASEIVGAEVLPPILADFRRQHGGIIIELMMSNIVDDLSRREADIAVRMAPPTQNALVAKKVGEVQLGFYATPEYLERHGSPVGMEELKGHTIVGFDGPARSIRDLAGMNVAVSR